MSSEVNNQVPPQSPAPQWESPPLANSAADPAITQQERFANGGPIPFFFGEKVDVAIAVPALDASMLPASFAVDTLLVASPACISRLGPSMRAIMPVSAATQAFSAYPAGAAIVPGEVAPLGVHLLIGYKTGLATPARPFREPLILARSKEIASLGNLMIGEIGAPHDTAADAMFVEALAFAMGALVLKFEVQPQRYGRLVGLDAARQEAVMRFVDKHLDQPIRMSDLARIAGCEVGSFIRAFKVTNGMSPHAFVLGRRIQTARHLLESTEASLAEIAYEVGFSSQSHMTAVFTRQLGISPGRYRREAREGGAPDDLQADARPDKS